MHETSDDTLLAGELETLLSATSKEELYLIAANGMASLIGAEQAVVWVRGSLGKPRVVAISGLSVVERNIDFTHWFESAAQVFGDHSGELIEAVPEDFENQRLHAERSLYLLEDAFHARLVSASGEVLGGLFVSRSGLFTQEDICLLCAH